MRSALRYAKKLTEQPSKMIQKDADDLFAAGHDDAALMNIVEVTAAFNMFNRMADGTGVTAENTKTTLTNKKTGSYIDNLTNFGLDVPDDLKSVI
jgi:hypothetical protein|tara:strand:- start:1457 stop:1741 length:285 start_codon:yes stop_codon:yes gene_type:complete